MKAKIMEANFSRHCFVTDHLISALKENCVLCLNGITFKGVLMYYIIREFVRLTNKSSIVVSQNLCSNEHANLKHWVGLHSNMRFLELSNCERLFDSNLLQEKASIYSISMESFLLNSQRGALANSISLLVIDLALDHISESTLIKVKPLFTKFIDYDIRVILILNIKEYLNCPTDIDGMLGMCGRVLPASIQLASDSIVIGQNGNVIETNVIDVEYTTISSDFTLCEIYEILNACEEVLSFYLKDRSLRYVVNLLLQHVTVLKQHLKMFGLLALALSLRKFVKLVESKVDEVGEHGILILKFFKTKSLILQTLIGFRNNATHEALSCSTLRKALDQLESILNGKTRDAEANGKFLFLVESNDAAEILFATLQELKLSKNFDYLDQFSVIMMNEACEHGILLNDCLIIVTTVNSDCLHRLKVDQCISFVIPHNYCALLDIKQSLKWKNGSLYVLITMDEDYIVGVKKIEEFQRIEAVVVKRFETYLNPNDVTISSLHSEDHLCAFQPYGKALKILPEASIAVVNRYCDYLKSGMSQATIDFDFLYCNDDEDKNESNEQFGEVLCAAQTRLFLPVKSMVRQAFQAPIVKLPISENLSTKLQLLSRMASCLQVCKMLHENNELDEILAPPRRAKNFADESTENGQILTRSTIYEKKIPILLKDSFPKQDSLVYIYVIETRKITMACYECYKKYLGFCSTRPLPKPSFLIYNRSEKLIKTTVAIEGCEILPKENIQPMYNFHAYVVRRVLRFSNFQYDDNSVDLGSDGVLWTVLIQNNGSYHIDYDFLETFRFLKIESDFYDNTYSNDRLTSPSYIDFNDKIIRPIHRKTDDVYYYAKCVRRDILVDDKLSVSTPDITFIDYYRSKYGINLTPGQFMVEVLPVQNYLNFLQLRYEEDNDTQISSKRRQTTFLPTELCDIHQIPAHLWMQIVAIPVILHRMSSMLYLDELEQLLMKELKLGKSEDDPCLDTGLFGVVTDIHKEKDQLGLQRVEEAVDQFIECAGPTDFIILTDKNSSSYPIQEEVFPINVGTIMCSDTKENYTGKVLKASITEDEPFYEGENSWAKKKPPSDNGSSGLVNKNNMNICEKEYLLQNAKLIAQNDKERKMPPLSLLLVAMTSVDACDLFNYERLEFLGDAFLAFSSAAELFLHNKNANECFLSRKKSRIVSNINLLAKGCDQNLWKFIVAEKFDFKTNALLVKLLNITPLQVMDDCKETVSRNFPKITAGNEIYSHDVCNDRKLTRTIRSSSLLANAIQRPKEEWFESVVRNKLVADCIEALIGLFYIHNGERITVDLMSWLNFQVCCICKKRCASQDDTLCAEKRKQTFEGKFYPEVVPRSNPGNTSSFCEIARVTHKPNVNSVKDFATSKKADKAVHTGETNDQSDNRRDRNLDISKQITINSRTSLIYEGQIASYTSEQIKDFEILLKYEFNDKKNLLEALLHPSYPCRCAPPVNSNERLEFLGDSIFCLLVADYICRRYPNATNAELTSMRCIVVNSKTFAKIAYLNNFHKFLMVVSPGFSKQLSSWSRTIERERKEGNLWPKWKMSTLAKFHELPISKLTIPKDLADVFESVAAAIYVDSGQLDVVWRSFYLLLKDVINSLP